jgi:very-short-patch-repair endonuclease
LKFRRQQVISGYVADFYCEAAKLVVEIDGNVHENEDVLENDKKKNAAYKERGFSNSNVLEQISTCLEKVKEIAALRVRKM